MRACPRKPLKTEQQAQAVAQKMTNYKGCQYYTAWCKQCNAYHISKDGK